MSGSRLEIRRRLGAIAMLLLLATGVPAASFAIAQPASAGNLAPVASTYFEPQKGSAARKAIMDAARIPVSRELGQSVIFVVDVLRTDGRMAYLQATPLNPDGTAFNWLASSFAEDWRSDFMSDVIMVLLENNNGRWAVKEHIIGPTDVAWYDWVNRFNLPESLFYAF